LYVVQRAFRPWVGVKVNRKECSFAIGLYFDAGVELLGERAHEGVPKTRTSHGLPQAHTVILNAKAQLVPKFVQAYPNDAGAAVWISVFDGIGDELIENKPKRKHSDGWQQVTGGYALDGDWMQRGYGIFEVLTELLQLGYLDPLIGARLIERKASWSEVEREMARMAGPRGLMIIFKADQGRIASLSGQERRCSLYLVGNPVIADQIISIDLRASFYVPFRVCLYDDGGPNCAVISMIDPRPFSQFAFALSSFTAATALSSIARLCVVRQRLGWHRHGAALHEQGQTAERH